MSANVPGDILNRAVEIFLCITELSALGIMLEEGFSRLQRQVLWR